MVSLIRREIAEQGANFINSANALFNRPGVKHSRPAVKKSAKCRLGVTVYYFQDDIDDTAESKAEVPIGHRKNLQRQSRPTKRNRLVGKSGRTVTKMPR
jgi:hypothetical protein